MTEKGSPTEKKSVRYAEKRREATCQFADRVAQVSVDHFNRIPEAERPSKTCMATIVAHYKGDLRVLSMGVGTKFLSESSLKEEVESGDYGLRVRDSHAEVLARRAFRRQLTVEILQDLQSPACRQNSILSRSSELSADRPRYSLKPGVSLHMYTSSAPCGNATLKKFAKMTREKFIELGPDEWPVEEHEPINGHAIRLGQFALLVKKDPSAHVAPSEDDGKESSVSKASTQPSKKVWPAHVSDDWTPPGTTIVNMRKGTIHSCSDKICLWNCLGLQGSLLACLLAEPLYISSLTVGRKLTGCICRRAVCCRLCRLPLQEGESAYRINHPSIMGTGVYLDESGVVEVDKAIRGQDVRFHSSMSWVWWHSIGDEDGLMTLDGEVFERIDGATGFLAEDSAEDTTGTCVSRVSTRSLLSIFLQVYNLAYATTETLQDPFGLHELLSIKRKLSPNHEAAKEAILTKHRILRQWRRRSQLMS